MARRGVRFIGGREFLLAGRAYNREDAQRGARGLRHSWRLVRIVKRSEWDYMLYVHEAL
jgi:hypothetical protein